MPAERIVVYGESLGGPIATDLAARRPVGGLILESAPSSILGVARHHYPFLPVAMFLSIRYDAAAKIGSVHSPLLILHSPGDEVVPFAMAEELYAAANRPSSSSGCAAPTTTTSSSRRTPIAPRCMTSCSAGSRRLTA